MNYKDAIELVSKAFGCKRGDLRLKDGGTIPGCTIHYRRWEREEEPCGEVILAVNALWPQIRMMTLAIRTHLGEEVAA